jgi:hypothetical protein
VEENNLGRCKLRGEIKRKTEKGKCERKREKDEDKG